VIALADASALELEFLLLLVSAGIGSSSLLRKAYRHRLVTFRADLLKARLEAATKLSGALDASVRSQIYSSYAKFCASVAADLSVETAS
jgi:hypothetical protein